MSAKKGKKSGKPSDSTKEPKDSLSTSADRNGAGHAGKSHENGGSSSNGGNAASDRSKSTLGVERVHVMGSLDKPLPEAEKFVTKGNTEVVLDFTGCTFVTVDGLEWLEELLIRADSASSSVGLEKIPPSVYKAFKVSHIDSILRACGSPSADIGPVC